MDTHTFRNNIFRSMLIILHTYIYGEQYMYINDLYSQA